MNLRRFALVVPALFVGCATPAVGPGGSLLVQADQQMAAANYRAARDLYRQFVATYPADTSVPRARGAGNALDRLIETQAELERVRGVVETRDAELAHLRDDLAERQRELEQLRAGGRLDAQLARVRRDLAERHREVDGLRAEVARLRAALDRLRKIDLHRESQP
jgi:TolA-binding protein